METTTVLVKRAVYPFQIIAYLHFFEINQNNKKNLIEVIYQNFETQYVKYIFKGSFFNKHE